MKYVTARRMESSTGSSHEHIGSLFMIDAATGAKGWWSVTALVALIERSPADAPVVIAPGVIAAVKVVRRPGHAPYLETRPDRTKRDNLLSLPPG